MVESAFKTIAPEVGAPRMLADLDEVRARTHRLVEHLDAGDLEPPNNVGVAGQTGIAVGAITPDRNSASAFWVWAAMDNLRLAAESAALIAGEVA